MTTALKVLGQASPTANTLTTIYTVPATNSAILSTITVCNRGTANAVFSLAVRPAGESIADKHYITYETFLPNKDTIYLTLGLALSATDVLSANVSTSDVSIGAYGTEVY